MKRWLFILGISSFAWGGWAQVPGDVDGSGIVEPADVSLLVDHLVQLNPLDASQEARAECNSDPNLDAGDLVWMVNHATQPPEMITALAGSFEMGNPWNDGGADELPVHDVVLSTFEIGRFSVTNAQYAAFLNSALASGEITVTSGVVYLTSNGTDPLFETSTAPTSFSQIEYSDGTFSVPDRQGYGMGDHPVIEVSWYGAAAYCNWLSRIQGYQEVYTESGTWEADFSRNGFHLPTEAQWERAAAWEPGHGHWRYGFTSDTINQTQANYYEGSHANPLGLVAQPYTSPVGYYASSESDLGCFDMSGGVREWCHDWYDSSYFSTSPLTDPTGPSPQSNRVLRGGSWGDFEPQVRSADRFPYAPAQRINVAGFRVARNP